MGIEREDGDGQLPTSATQVAGASSRVEEAERLPEIKLTVAGPCHNPVGRYVGLNKFQRERFGIKDTGELVELFDEQERSLGVFTVGAGSKALLRETGKFTVNGIPADTVVTVRPCKRPPENEQEFAIEHGIEQLEKHTRRHDVIEKRFPGADPDTYITIPTPLAGQIGILPPPGQTIASISLATIRDANGEEKQIAVVPSGTGIGCTAKAAQVLNIPPQLSAIRIRVDKGVLVIS